MDPYGGNGQTQQISVCGCGVRFCQKSYGICWVSERFSTEGSITWVEKSKFIRSKSQQPQCFEACRGISHSVVLKKGQNGIS